MWRCAAKYFYCGLREGEGMNTSSSLLVVLGMVPFVLFLFQHMAMVAHCTDPEGPAEVAVHVVVLVRCHVTSHCRGCRFAVFTRAL